MSDEARWPGCSARPFAELRDSGLLWLINAAVFHPRGVALALVMDDDGNATGWQLLGTGGDEPWRFESSEEIHERFRAAEATIQAARDAATNRVEAP